MQKGSPREVGQIFIFLLVGILILAAAGGAYFLGRSTSPKPSATPVVSPASPAQRGEQTPQPTSTPSPSNTSPAPTGTAETANWKTYTNTAFGYSIKFPDTYAVSSQSDKEKSQLGDASRCIVTKIDGKCSVLINSFKNTAKLSLEEWVKKYEIPLSTYSGNAKISKSNLNGYNALSARNETQVVYYLENNSNIFYIESSINQEDLSILDTFKFL